jgi:hypothetical protein
MYQLASRSSSTFVRLGILSAAMATSLLTVALYWSDLACGILAGFAFLCAMCEFGFAAVTRP